MNIRCDIYNIMASNNDSGKTGRKTTAIRLVMLETGVSQFHGGPIEGPLKSLGPSQHYHIEEFMLGSYLAPITLRVTSFSNNECNFYPFWHRTCISVITFQKLRRTFWSKIHTIMLCIAILVNSCHSTLIFWKNSAS